MEEVSKSQITVIAKIEGPIDLVWKLWTSPEDIVIWNSASDDWHTPVAENDLRVGGKFRSRMESRDGSMGFDFTGTYQKVEPLKLIEYVMEDGRKVSVKFRKLENEIEVVETFEAEGINSIELQQAGWQSILNNFKKYAEQKIVE